MRISDVLDIKSAPLTRRSPPQSGNFFGQSALGSRMRPAIQPWPVTARASRSWTSGIGYEQLFAFWCVPSDLDWLQPVRFCSRMTAAAGTCHSSSCAAIDRCTFCSGRLTAMGRTTCRATPTRQGDRLLSTQSSHGCRWSFPQHKEWRPGIVQVLRVVVPCAAFDAPLSRGVLFTTSTLTAGAGRQKAAETRPTA